MDIGDGERLVERGEDRAPGRNCGGGLCGQQFVADQCCEVAAVALGVGSDHPMALNERDEAGQFLEQNHIRVQLEHRGAKGGLGVILTPLRGRGVGSAQHRHVPAEEGDRVHVPVYTDRCDG